MTEHCKAFVVVVPRGGSAHWPPKEGDDQTQVTIVMTSNPDTLGRQSFWIKWYDGRWRAQHFCSQVENYVQQYRDVYQIEAVVVEELEER